MQVGVFNPGPQSPAIDDRADTLFRRLRRASYARSGAVRDLPVASHYQVPTPGLTGGGAGAYVDAQWSADFLVSEVQSGNPVLPVVSWVSQSQQYQTAGAYSALMERAFYAPLRYLKANKLPVTVSMTQLTNLFFSAAHEQNAMPLSLDPRVRKADGSILGAGVLDPLSSVHLWREAARQMLGDTARPYSSTIGSESPGAILREIARVYPDPPSVYLVSNNEDRILAPLSFTGSNLANYVTEWKRGVDTFGSGMSVDALTDEINKGYGHRFYVLHDEAKRVVRGMFPNSQVCLTGYVNARSWGAFAAWRTYLFVRNASGKLVGYDRVKGLDSVSLSTYPLVNYADTTARSAFANCIADVSAMRTLNDGSLPQVEEIAVHDGSEFGGTAFTANSYTPNRYKGTVRHLMWLTRPRIVREWRSSTSRRSDLGHDGVSPRSTYWRTVVDACAEVHSNSTLARFWSQSAMTFNTNRSHPYTLNLLGTADETQRPWPYLPTSNEPSTWSSTPIALTDTVTTWAIAYMIGRGVTAEYLLFAHSPTGSQNGVTIAVRKDDGSDMNVMVNTTPQGNFWTVTPAGVTTLVA